MRDRGVYDRARGEADRLKERERERDRDGILSCDWCGYRTTR